MNLLSAWTRSSGALPSHSTSNSDLSTYIILGILVLLLLSAILIGLALKDKDDKPDPDNPRWWEKDDWVIEPDWPGGGAIPPKKEEKKLADANLRVSK